MKNVLISWAYFIKSDIFSVIQSWPINTLSMKFKFILSALILLSIRAFSQTKNNLALVYGAAANTVDIHGDFDYSSDSVWVIRAIWPAIFHLKRVFYIQTV